jgi:hypothetical protein
MAAGDREIDHETPPRSSDELLVACSPSDSAGGLRSFDDER